MERIMINHEILTTVLSEKLSWCGVDGIWKVFECGVVGCPLPGVSIFGTNISTIEAVLKNREGAIMILLGDVETITP